MCVKKGEKRLTGGECRLEGLVVGVLAVLA